MRVTFSILAILLLFFGVSPTFAGDPPIPINPTNNITVTSSKVEWQTPSYQLYSSNPYRVQVDDDSSFGSLNKDYYTANTTYTPSLSEGTWYWKVKAKDASGTWSDWSSIWSFILNTTSTPTPSPTSTSTSTPTSTPSSTSSTSSFTISNIPSQIDSTEEFKVSVNLSIPNSPSTTFYLKGAFKKAGSSNYFGLTKVSGSWVKNNKTYSDQYKITTDGSGNWSGNLEVQPDILDSGYEGVGEYIFKVGRYTDNGSLNWSNEVKVMINAQEVILEDDNSEILGAVGTQSKKDKPKSQVEKYSLEKYIKAATPASKPLSATPSAKVKGERQTNFLTIVGAIIVIIGVIPIAYAIYNKFRKRDQEIS